MFDFIYTGEFYSVFCAFLWAIAIILFRKSGERVAPVPLNLFKCSVSLIILLLGMLIAGISLTPAEQTLEDWVILLISGALGIGIADSVFFASLNRLGAGRSAIVDCLYSPFIILCSFMYLHEPIGPSLLIAMLLMTTAILVGAWRPDTPGINRNRPPPLIPPPLMGEGRVEDSSSEHRQIRYGIFLGIASMLMMAVGIVLAKPVLDRSGPWWATTVRLLGGTAVLLVQASFRKHRHEVARCFRPGPLWKVTVPASIIGGFLAMLFWIMGMKYTYTNVAGILNQSSTVFILVLATIFLEEPLTPRKVIAIALGVAGGIIAAL